MALKDCRCNYCAFKWSALGQKLFEFSQHMYKGRLSPVANIMGVCCPNCKSSGFVLIVE